jgi:hypothetical protein
MSDEGGGYFTTDRAKKYGWGVPRLALLTLFAFEVVPRRFLAAAPLGPHPDADDAAANSLSLAAYLGSGRWVGHAYMGSIGAGVNVQVLGFLGNLAVLLLAALFCVWDATWGDLALVAYLVKTFGGDFIAGKLDTAEWRLVLLWTFGLFGPVALWLTATGGEASFTDASTGGGFTGGGFTGDARWAALRSTLEPYARVVPILFATQTVCELGDAHLEHHPLVGKFFRHRYGFEAFTLATLVALPGGIRTDELRVVQFDLVVCLFYRVSNLAIIAIKSGAIRAASAAAEAAARKACFRVFGLLRGTRIVNVTDPDVAFAVLRSSAVKGDALERHVATPAWRPLLSLESVDGELYRSMLADFHALVKRLPPPSRVGEIAAKNVRRLMDEDEDDEGNETADPKGSIGEEGTTFAEVSFANAGAGTSAAAKKGGEGGPAAAAAAAAAASTASLRRRRAPQIVDADAVARLSLATFVEYLFDREWEDAFEVLVEASWEWRKEIAVRGRADPRTKRRAVDLVVNELLARSPTLWSVFGERWREPRYFSLIMQPFLISPAINVGDVAVALADEARGRSAPAKLEDAMRAAHPFPIFERWVDEPVVLRGQTVVRKNTQVIVFTSDLAPRRTKGGGGGGSASWPVFGAGPRACAGTTLALGVLRAVAKGCVGRERFRPSLGHRFSGRNNDGKTTPGEAWYFARTVVPVVLGLRKEPVEAEALERRARDALEGER